MTTIVNTPPAPSGSGGSIGVIVGIVVLAIAAYLFFIYGLPAIQQMGSPQITPQINVPGKIDVNINQSK